MANLQQIVAWCDDYLEAKAFKDYCPNGLQIQGKEEVEILVSSVTASLDAIEQALDLNADALLVHHGYFWKGEPSPLTGLKGKRVKQLMQNDVSLIAYHLPLDAHTAIGNNAVLAKLLGLNIVGALDPSERYPIGNVATLTEPMTGTEFAQHLHRVLGQQPLHIAGHQGLIKKVGFCSGAAQDYLYKAVELGCDAYFSGEVSERTFHESVEYGIDYFAAGHHATERYGVQRLAELLNKQFNLTTHYVELNNPV
ncbi:MULTISPECIES: Nif3-like dinuclear metal center hexameric protein [unclassified Acinetobacter]|uniref:Nif3-like dinuclear metal center hexameric protein n=1 Tax=unclassified Acinetobacter TaxID=196816 RepID=UPI0035B6B11F